MVRRTYTIELEREEAEIIIGALEARAEWFTEEIATDRANHAALTIGRFIAQLKSQNVEL